MTPLTGCGLTIGNFDGVHLGHRRLIARAGELSQDRPAVVMCFDPHPMAVLNPRQRPGVLTPMDMKLKLLEEAGADAAAIVPVDRAMLELSAEQFVREMIVARFRPRAVVEGPTFGFGKNREGDPEMLRELGLRYGFAVDIVPGVQRELHGHHEPVTISSTLIRRLIGGGAVESAAECLGRPYRLAGRLVPGRAVGRTIGFPTANLAVAGQLVPADGVYAAVARCESFTGPAAVSIGAPVTFEVRESAIEAHLIGFSGTLGDEAMELDMVARLRGIEKFESVETLVEQIGRDVEQTRVVLKSVGMFNVQGSMFK